MENTKFNQCMDRVKKTVLRQRKEGVSHREDDINRAIITVGNSLGIFIPYSKAEKIQQSFFN